MKNNYLSEAINGVQYIFTLVQTEETLRIINLVCAIAVSVVLIAFRIWRWWKEAKADGKITKEEIKDGVDIIIDGVAEVQDALNGKENKSECLPPNKHDLPNDKKEGK